MYNFFEKNTDGLLNFYFEKKKKKVIDRLHQLKYISIF